MMSLLIFILITFDFNASIEELADETSLEDMNKFAKLVMEEMAGGAQKDGKKK